MLDALTRGYLNLYPAAAARTLARLDNRDLQEIFQAMPPPLAANVLEHMAPGSALRCLQLLKNRPAGEILARIPAQPAVAILRLAPREQANTLLSVMPRATAARLRLQLRYPETVVGSFLDSEVLTLHPDHRVADALRLVRRNRQGPGHILYVLDDQRRLAGQVDLWDLLNERDRSLVQTIVRPVPVVLNARAAIQTVANHPAWLTNENLPVVNRTGVFQGVLPRSRVTDEEQNLIAEVSERNELSTTRTALADIFWLGLAALFAGGGTAPKKEPET